MAVRAYVQSKKKQAVTNNKPSHLDGAILLVHGPQLKNQKNNRVDYV